MKNRFLSVILTTVMLFSLTTPAFALPNKEWMNIIGYGARRTFAIDRGEVCEYLVKLYCELSGESVPYSENSFWDVSTLEHPYVAAAYDLGFVTGTDGNTFSPHNLVTRTALSVMIYRVVKKAYPNLDMGGCDNIFFPDGAPDWAYYTLQFAFSRGLTAGHNGQYQAIGAWDCLTLEETAEMLQKAYLAAPDFASVYNTFNIKRAYLTFDDAPSANTVTILNTLKKYNVKASFFITGRTNSDLVKRMADEGHTVGNHTSSHDYGRIYASSSGFWNDFNSEGEYLRGILGYTPKIMRFPGGSNNTVSYNYGGRGIMHTLAEQARANGYIYFDWNVSSGDASGNNVAKSSIVGNVLNGARGVTSAVVLMHQTAPKTTTAAALPEIIEGLQQQGFVIVGLTEYSYCPQFLK